ncbi:MAG: DNA ligase, partial [Bacilli bacterium]|nr:DNA ligase [Bacilli bacterium]
MKFGEYFKPMLLTEVDKPFDDEEYLYELKFDGIRATIHVSPSTFIIYNRNGYDITYLYPELKNIKKLVKDKCIFDGEIVAFDNTSPSFSKLQQRSHIKDKTKIASYSENEPVCFVVFDCIYKNQDITKKPLIERKKVLEKFKDNDYFIKTQYTLKEGTKLFKKVKKASLEGIVAKKINSEYELNTRTRNWLKIKNFKDEEFYIGGYIDTKAKTSLLLGEYRKNKFCYVGKVSITRTRD